MLMKTTGMMPWCSQSTIYVEHSIQLPRREGSGEEVSESENEKVVQSIFEVLNDRDVDIKMHSTRVEGPPDIVISLAPNPPRRPMARII